MRKYDTCLQWQKVLQLYTRANMADSGSGTNVVGVELTAKDIPGADLAEPFERYQIPKLKWWLLCRGIKAPSSWKKPQLIARCPPILQNYKL